MTLYTVGHGNRSTEELVAVLRSASVERLVDIRRFPSSRRNPHLAEEVLRRSLPDLGVDYQWWGEELGGRRVRRNGATRHPAWRDAAFQGYADHTDLPAFREAIERLRAGAATVATAVMCAETLWWRCHRRLVADAVELRGTEVVHLLDSHHHQRHRLHPSLREGEDGWPVWDVGADQAML